MTRLNKIFLFIVVLFIFFYLTAGKRFFYSYPETAKDYQYLSLFSDVVGKTKAYYMDEIEPNERFPEAYSAMLSTLHTASAYLDKEQTRNHDFFYSRKVCGAGVFGKQFHNYFYITDVMNGSAAHKGGLKPGDVIRSIQGKSLFPLTFWQMYFSLFSESPASLELKVLKKGDEKPVDITLTTEPIHMEVRVQKMGQDITLVELPIVDARGVSVLKEILSATGPVKIIIDLRRYSGGDMESLLEMGQLFFESSPGQKLTLKKKDEELEYPVGSLTPSTYKAVVIVNSSTILYGELLAALFKQIKPRAGSSVTLVGDKTGGMISRIKHVHFEDGTSILIPDGLFFFKGKSLSDQRIIPHTKLKDKDFEKVLDTCTAILSNDNGEKEKKI